MKSVIVQFSKLAEHEDWRWDGEYFCYEPYLSSQLAYEPIGSILTFSQYGISIDMNEDGNGHKIYRMNEISNMLCDRVISKYAKITSEEVKKYKLENNDVLFNRTNSQVFVGRTGIYKKFSEEDIVFASYLVRFRTNEDKVLPEYLTTFLNTKYGIQDIKRRARISINQSNVNPEELKRVKIPLLSITFQKHIRHLFALAFELINKSENIYRQAEERLLFELGLRDWQPQHALSFVGDYTEVQQAERFDAEYFQPKYQHVIDAIKQHDYFFIANIETFNRRGVQPEYMEDGEIKVVTSKHIGAETIDYDNLDRTTRKAWFENKTAQIKQNDILIYTTGANVGRTQCYLDTSPTLASNHVNILRLNKLNPIYAGLFINSLLGQLQVRQNVSGSAQVELYPSDISKFILWNAPAKTQDEIANMVIQSKDVRQTSKQLLEIAKRAVEMAIEQDEATATGWLKNETARLGIEIEKELN